MRCITRSDSRADQKSCLIARMLWTVVAAFSPAVASLAAPVTALAWSAVDPSVRGNMESMVMAFPGANPKVVAQQLKQKPAGRRALLLVDFGERLATHPLDACRAPDGKGGWKLTTWRGPWTSAGLVDVRRASDRFFAQLAAEGAPIDMLVLDEETDFAVTKYMRDDFANLLAIQADPRFPALAKRLGFSDVRRIDYGTPEYYTWNEVLLADFDVALQGAIVTPFRARWPQASVSNYGSAPIRRPAMTPGCAGIGVVRGGVGVGTHNSIDFYGLVSPYLRGTWFSGIRLQDSAFDMFRSNVHRVRAVAASSGKGMLPWIGAYGLGTRPTDVAGIFPSPLSGNAYWDENVIQLVMHGCDTLLVYNPHAWMPEQIRANCNTVSDQQHLSGLIDDLNGRLGGNAGAVRWYTLAGMTDRVMATGRRVQGGTLWRFSFAPDVSSVVVSLQGGEVREIVPEQGSAGAWYFESDAEPLAIKADGTDVAWTEATKGSPWPDVDGDGSLSTGDTALMLLDMGQESDMDLDGDRVVTQSDLDFFQARCGGWTQAARAAQGWRPGSLTPSEQMALNTGKSREVGSAVALAASVR